MSNFSGQVVRVSAAGSYSDTIGIEHIEKCLGAC